MAGSRTERSYYVESSMTDSNRFTGQERTSYGIYEVNSREAARLAAIVSSVSAIERRASEEDRSMTRGERAEFERLNRERSGILQTAGRRVHYTSPLEGNPFRMGEIIDQARFSRLPVRSTETLKGPEKVAGR